MTNHIWRVATGGMLLWEPASEATIVQTTEEQPPWKQLHIIEPDLKGVASGHECAEQEQILLPIEHVFGSLHIDPESDGDCLTYGSSISPPSFPLNQSPTPSAGSPGSSSTCSELLLESNLRKQLEELAHAPRADSIEPSQVQSESSGQGSDSIDLQLTPCPLRMTNTSRRLLESEKPSYRFKRKAVADDSQRVRRKLIFEMGSRRFTPAPHAKKPTNKISSPRHPSKLAPNLKELNNLQSLQALSNIERAPSHQWDEDERALLTILYRWYDSADPWIIPQVFNEITGLRLKLSVVRYQFEGHILLYGGLAFPEYARVMAVPFQDPERIYDDIHGIIEDTAAGLGLSLSRRETEVRFHSGAARHAKSPRTRRTYRSLVRRAAEKEREKARVARRANQSIQMAVPQQPLPAQRRLIGNMTLAIGSEEEAEEQLVDCDDANIHESIADQCQTSMEPIKRTIAFRVWDAKSRTAFDEDNGFTSQAFSIWRGEHPPPFSLDGQGQQALLLLTNLHLCLKGGASTFVSLSTSLLQALVKASTMDNPRIAVVALDHPLLTAANKTLPAADVLQMLKSEGQAWWARYKGHAERMVWASVPAPTILSHLPLSALHALAATNAACSQLLNLHAFRPGRPTRHVSKHMRDQGTSLNASSARAMAAIARAFGMHSDKASLAHIQGLVAALVDSFQIACDDEHVAGAVAHVFAQTLHAGAHGVDSVAKAFRDGVRQGVDVTEFYARPRLRASGVRG